MLEGMFGVMARGKHAPDGQRVAASAGAPGNEEACVVGFSLAVAPGALMMLSRHSYATVGLLSVRIEMPVDSVA